MAVLTGRSKQRGCDETREFLGTRETGAGTEKSTQQVICGDLEEYMLSGPFSESLLGGDFAQAHLNSLGAEIKDLGKRTSQPWAMRHMDGAKQTIFLTTQPTMPGLSGAMGILGLLGNPPGAKFDSEKGTEGLSTGGGTGPRFYHGDQRGI